MITRFYGNSRSRHSNTPVTSYHLYAYNSTSKQFLLIENNKFIIRETSHTLKSALKATHNTPKHLNSFFGLKEPAHSDVNFNDLKAKVEVLIKDIQNADLNKFPD